MSSHSQTSLSNADLSRFKRKERIFFSFSNFPQEPENFRLWNLWKNNLAFFWSPVEGTPWKFQTKCTFSHSLVVLSHSLGVLNQQTQTDAPALVERWITRFGCPVDIHSDKWTDFLSDVLRELSWIIGHGRTSTFSFQPQEQQWLRGQAEKWKKTLYKNVVDHQHEREFIYSW